MKFDFLILFGINLILSTLLGCTSSGVSPIIETKPSFDANQQTASVKTSVASEKIAALEGEFATELTKLNLNLAQAEKLSFKESAKGQEISLSDCLLVAQNIIKNYPLQAQFKSPGSLSGIEKFCPESTGKSQVKVYLNNTKFLVDQSLEASLILTIQTYSDEWAQPKLEQYLLNLQDEIIGFYSHYPLVEDGSEFLQTFSKLTPTGDLISKSIKQSKDMKAPLLWKASVSYSSFDGKIKYAIKVLQNDQIGNELRITNIRLPYQTEWQKYEFKLDFPLDGIYDSGGEVLSELKSEVSLQYLQQDDVECGVGSISKSGAQIREFGNQICKDKLESYTTLFK